MCYHFKQTKTIKELEKKFNAKIDSSETLKPSAHINGFNYPKTPIITNLDASKIQMFNWGLIPDWANEDWKRNYTLNARIETLSEKPAFKQYTENRCIILVDGFYEWQHKGKEKIKFDIGFNNQLFAFAGLYSNDTYTIVTTEAKGIMREIHNTKLRMPFSLKTDDDFNKWLNVEEVYPRYDFTTNQLGFTQPTLF
jgi:putative SOS response-associated peptidase YedK